MYVVCGYVLSEVTSALISIRGGARVTVQCKYTNKHDSMYICMYIFVHMCVYVKCAA